jgi:predicted MFS family arabinose efflux permease
MNRDVWLLFCCQALLNAVMSGQIVMASIIGGSLASPTMTTLPIAIQMAGVMAGSIPAGIVFARLGRRPGFWLGAVLLLCGSLGFALGVWRASFPIYCLAAVPAGMGFGISQHLRFAAAEVAAPEARARAISLVLSGGLVAAVLGPEIVIRTNDAIPGFRFLGTYLSLLALPAAASILLAFIRLPPATPRTETPVSFRDIVGRPNFLTAVVAAMAGYGSMNLVMSSTPLQMTICGFGVDAAAEVIRAHSIAMFLPSFVTGRLIQRFGAHSVILAGALLTSFCVAVDIGLAPIFATFVVGLMLLGVGWNFMFVGGTALLTTAHSPEERVRVQATNDFIVFGTVAATAFASGAIETTAGWGALNLSVLPAVLIAVGLVIWHWTARPRLAV